MRRVIFGVFFGLCTTSIAGASPVGERHLTTTEASAALRDANHGDQLRITIWYPAAARAVEEALDIGPPNQPLFRPGKAAPEAGFADDKARPVILLSHGFGGTARVMAWFGTALAREGFIVIAVDHPGNNGRDTMTIAGATLFWERPGDLRAALARVKADGAIAPHLDLARLGVSGFSAGGFTGLAAAGARVDIRRFQAFCMANPTDGVCAPQKEFPVSAAQAEQFLMARESAGEIARSRDDLSISGVKAAFLLAPAIVQSLDPGSLSRFSVPVDIVLGAADDVANPKTNGEVAAATIPGARITILPGVGHYDFLSECTPAGEATIPVCPTKVPRSETHKAAIDEALAFFHRALGEP
ncbi:MAG: alpha/beta hydrolase [Hyphomicrobiales bacterium]|nr:alpha/beta hydrolase [Hyphomicrobiales bacterium]